MEPERPIERTLRATAQKRREEAGGPFELHPVTRKLLQGEVARKYAAAERESKSSPFWMKWTWPRFAFGAATAAVVVILAGLLGVFKGDKPSYAERETKGAREFAASSVRQAEPTQAPESLDAALSKQVAASSQPSTDATTDAAAAITASRAALPPAQVVTLSPQVVPQNEPVAAAGLLSLTESRVVVAPQPQGNFADLKAQTDAVHLRDGFLIAQGSITTNSLQSTFSFSAGAEKANPPAASSVEPKKAPAVNTLETANALAAKEFSNDFKADKEENVQSYNGNAPTTKALPGVRRESKPTVATASSGLSPSASHVAPAAPQATVSARLPARSADASFQKRPIDAVQTFSQTSLGTKAKINQADRAANVLVNFQVEQNGPEMRIIDHDGSVYTGSWRLSETPHQIASPKSQTGDTLASKPERKLTETAGASAPQSQPSQTFQFTVSGTNRTLKQKVVFTGNLQPAAETDSSRAVQTESFGVKTTSDNSNVVLPLVNAQISGQAVIGDKRVLEIKAAPAKQ